MVFLDYFLHAFEPTFIYFIRLTSLSNDSIKCVYANKTKCEDVTTREEKRASELKEICKE